MILEGNQRGGAKNLALHLMKQENEHVEVHELRGFVSQDLMGALNETYAISRGTHCTQFLYSLSLNPPLTENVSIADFEAAIEKSEKELGLEGQPRAIVFHEKEGPNGMTRRHAHAVWSRIDIENMKAIQMSFDHSKLQSVSRELYLEHGWKMPRGFARQSERDPRNFTHAEWQQAKRVNKDPRAIKTALADAWAISDSKVAFSHALQERGYYMARGDKKGRIVAVDIHGEVYSIPRQIGIKVKAVRARIGGEDDLPSVSQARHKIAHDMLPIIMCFKENLQTQETTQKAEFTKKRDELVTKQRTERQSFMAQITQRQNQETLKRQSRFRSGYKGIWDRLRGEHKRIAAENEKAAKLALARDRGEKERLITHQLAQRRMFGQWKLALRESFHEKRCDLKKDRAVFKRMQKLDLKKPEHPAPDSQKPERQISTRETRREEFVRMRRKTTPRHSRAPTREPEL